MHRLQFALKLLQIFVSVVRVLLHQDRHAILVDRLAPSAVHMKRLHGVSDCLGWLFDNRWDELGKGLPLAWHPPPVHHIWANLVKNVLQKGVLSAQLIYWTVAEAVTLLCQSVLVLMDSCNRDLNLLKWLTLAQVYPDVATTDFGQSSGHGVAEADQVRVVEHHGRVVVQVFSLKLPLLFAFLHQVSPGVLSFFVLT